MGAFSPGADAAPSVFLIRPYQHQHADHQHQWENAARQHASLQIVTAGLGHRAGQAGAEGAAQIPCHGKQREHGGTTVGHPLGGNADGSAGGSGSGAA